MAATQGTQPWAEPMVHKVAALTAHQARDSAHKARSNQRVARVFDVTQASRPRVAITVGAGARPTTSAWDQGRAKARTSSGCPAHAQPHSSRPVQRAVRDGMGLRSPRMPSTASPSACTPNAQAPQAMAQLMGAYRSWTKNQPTKAQTAARPAAPARSARVEGRRSHSSHRRVYLCFNCMDAAQRSHKIHRHGIWWSQYHHYLLCSKRSQRYRIQDSHHKRHQHGL